MRQNSANTPSDAGHAVGTAAPGVCTSRVRPEWIRLPRTNQRCPYTGLSRSGLNELILASKANDFKPPVRSVVSRKRGAIRGTRLINFDSICDYLNGLTAQCEDTPAA
jgi:hypothetical protein